MKTKLFYLLIPAIVAPICLTATSCSTLNLQKVKNLGYLSNSFDSYGSLSTYTKSFKNLYYGDKKVNNGNYVVLFGTAGKTTITPSKDASTTGTIATAYPNYGLSMFSQDVTTWNKDDMKNINDNLSCDSNSRILDDVAKWKNDGHEYNIRFFSFFYNCKDASYINRAKVENTQVETQDIIFSCSPFQTWTKDDFSNLQYNTRGEEDCDREKKYWNDWEKKHEEGKYIRNDQQAIKYRELVKELQTLSPTSFDSITGDNSVVALYYKDGKANSVKTYTDSPDIYSDMSSIYPENTLKDGNK